MTTNAFLKSVPEELVRSLQLLARTAPLQTTTEIKQIQHELKEAEKRKDS